MVTRGLQSFKSNEGVWEYGIRSHSFPTPRLDKLLFTYQGQTTDAPSKSSTVPQGLRPPHFVQIFDNVYFPLSFHSLGSLNDIHINAISLQWGYSEDIAIHIEYYGKYEAIPFGIIQRLIQSSKSHLHFRISKQFAHNNQL